MKQPVLRGRQLLAIPGPTNIPDRILRAMDRPATDFNSPAFLQVQEEIFEGLKRVFRTEHDVFAYASSGRGAWEAAFVNTLSPGDRVLVPETGAFSLWWEELASDLALVAERMEGDWRHGPDPDAIRDRLRRDRGGEIKALCLVHNETSTGIASRVAEVRRAIDAAGHGALFMVDTISSLASIDFRMDEWGVDVAVGGSQKGLMLPPGLGFVGAGPKAIAAAETAGLGRSYWDWKALRRRGGRLGFTSTSPVHLVYGLQESIRMLEEEGLERTFARHRRLGAATRAAIRAWRGDGVGPELLSLDPREHSDSVSTVLLPEGHDAEAVRKITAVRFNVLLGGGLGKLAGRAFRIAHMGDLNEAMLLAMLAVVEMALDIEGVPRGGSGVEAAMKVLAVPEA